MYEHLFHEIVFGTLAANIIIVATLLKLVRKTWVNFRSHSKLVLKQHEILWAEHTDRHTAEKKS